MMDTPIAKLNGQPGELRFTIEIKRVATGLIEIHELVGKILPDLSAETEEKETPCL